MLKYYEREKDLVIQCDASEVGLGAALLLGRRLLAYASGALTAAERNYAQIDKDLLAIVTAERIYILIIKLNKLFFFFFVTVFSKRNRKHVPPVSIEL